MPVKVIGLVALVVGVILVVYGINASDSLSSEVKEALEGTPTDKALWLLIGGAALGVLGLAVLARGVRSGRAA
jgi:drug/metabolite transporter (DMT)-like permease